uniref:Uncharacterized protein n=1 Tax=Setaria viridis TaxID=4556 RepID=A0A4U6WSQ1_SETVI|nr:hypothetical protein SEVIR_1G369000v2 [Setaria viridis]
MTAPLAPPAASRPARPTHSARRRPARPACSDRQSPTRPCSFCPPEPRPLLLAPTAGAPHRPLEILYSAVPLRRGGDARGLERERAAAGAMMWSSNSDDDEPRAAARCRANRRAMSTSVVAAEEEEQELPTEV